MQILQCKVTFVTIAYEIKREYTTAEYSQVPSRYYVAHSMGCNQWLNELLIKFEYPEKATKIWLDLPLSFDVIK